MIYHREKNKEIFLTRAYALDLETESLSLVEAKASAKRVREIGKTISNQSILAEVEDRSNFAKKKTKKQRRKEEQELVKPYKPSSTIKKNAKWEDEDAISSVILSDDDLVEVIDYEQLQDDFNF